MTGDGTHRGRKVAARVNHVFPNDFFICDIDLESSMLRHFTNGQIFTTVSLDNVVRMFGAYFTDHNGIHRICQKCTFFSVDRCQGFILVVAYITILSDIDDVVLVHSRTQDGTSRGHA